MKHLINLHELKRTVKEYLNLTDTESLANFSRSTQWPRYEGMCGGSCPGLSVDEDGIFLGIKMWGFFSRSFPPKLSARPDPIGLCLLLSDFYRVASKCAADAPSHPSQR